MNEQQRKELIEMTSMAAGEMPSGYVENGRQLWRAFEIGKNQSAAELAQLKAWKDAIQEACISDFIEMKEPTETLAKLIEWNVKMALDPAISKDANDLIEEHTKHLKEEREALLKASKELVKKLMKNKDTWDEVAVLFGTYKTDATVADIRKFEAALAEKEG